MDQVVLETTTPVITISKSSNSEEIYLIHKFSSDDPEKGVTEESDDLVVIINDLTKEEIRGYKAKISLDNLTETDGRKTKRESQKWQEIKKALLEQDNFYFQIKHADVISFFTSSREKIGSIPLSKISSSLAVQILATQCLSTTTQFKENLSTVQSKLIETENKVLVTETTLKNLVVQKNLMEDHMYRAFHKCLNTKKDKIAQLQAQIKSNGSSIPVSAKIVPKATTKAKTKAATPSPAKKPRRGTNRKIVYSDNSDETGSEPEVEAEEIELNDDSSSSDYNADTDTETSPEKIDVPAKAPQRSKQIQKKVIELSDDSLDESFPELEAPRKLRSTGQQLKLKGKVPEKKKEEKLFAFDDDDDSSTTDMDIDVLESTKLMPQGGTSKKQPEMVDEKNLEEFYDCDKLMDEI